MDRLVLDLRYSLRMLRKSPLVTAAALFSLAIGIGANTAMFSWLDALVLSPLRAPDEPERLVHLYSTDPSGFRGSYSYLNYRDERDRNEVFDGMVAWRNVALSFSDGNDSERIYGRITSGNFWEVMGVEAALGRTYGASEDEVPGRDPLAVLSHAFWKRRFASDPGVAGRTILLNGHPFTIAGVLPESYRYAAVEIDADLYAPLTMMGVLIPGTDRLNRRGWGFLEVVGRLKRGISLAEAQAHMMVVARELSLAYPDQNRDRTVTLVPESRALLPAEAQGAMTTTVLVLMGLVGFVLLIACGNVANLQLARAKAREGEIGVRVALGAGRSRLLGQLFTESAVLALLAAGTGVALAFALSRAVRSISIPVGAPVHVDVGLNLRVLSFTVLVAVFSAVVFGLAPALRASRGPGSSSRLLSGSRALDVLVTFQVALSLILLIGASLFLKSLRAAQDVDPGFDPDSVLLVSLDPGLQGYDGTRARGLYQDLARTASGLSGVASLGYADSAPIQLGTQQWDVEIEGYVPAANERMNLDYAIVSSGYFETLRIPLLAGRDFGAQDHAEGQGSLIVNETMARRFWPERDITWPIGRPIRTGGRDRTVVGVVADSKVYSLGERPLAFMYLPYEQMDPATSLTLFVRTRQDPQALVEPLRAAVRDLDQALPLYDVQTMHERLAFGLLPSRLSANVLAAFSMVALAMASIGLYGVTAYGVAQRTREIGLRLALGAAAADVLRLVLKRVLAMSLAGLAAGIAGGVLLGYLARGALFGSGASEPATYLAGALVIAVSVLLAGLLPARRAVRIDPITALRHP
jgi:predicted permease